MSVTLKPLRFSPCRADATGRNSIAQTVSRAVITLRTRKGLSQGALAALAGISRSSINAIESGQKENLHVSTLVRLAYALAVRPDGLLGHAPCPPTRPGVIPLLLLGRLPRSKP